LAVFVFDYRHFGDSQGEPRQLLSVRKQLADIRAAVDHVRGLAEVDGDRVGLWGTSFGGGHAIVTASRNYDVKAVVAQVPHVDGRASAMSIGLKFMAKCLVAGLRDVSRAVLGRQPYYVPVVGPPETFACLNTPGTYDGYLALVPPDSGWRNEVAARVLLTIGTYRPTALAAKIKCPLLLMPARHDNLIPLEAVEKLAAKVPSAELKIIDAEHFDVYTGDLFEETVAVQTEFLVTNLLKKA
jgi:dienelactone hydrolase